jgi:hypothetical protein
MTQVTRSLTRKNISPPSGREILFLFHKNIHNVNVFVKKIKKYPAAAGESAVHLVKCPVCMLTA